MKTIRANTFEINSSSTHSMVILTEEQNDKMNNGELYLTNKYDETIITKEERDAIFYEAISNYNETIVNYNDEMGAKLITTIEEFMETDDYLDNRSEFPCDIYEWSDREYLAYDSANYTSPSGDKLVIHVVYGNDY